VAQQDNPTTSTTLVVGFVGAILTFVVIVALEAMYYHFEKAETQAKNADFTPASLTQLRAEQQEQLQTIGWIDREKGIVRIPIDVAKNVVRREMRSTTRPASGSTETP
jgi:hypothetical protein